MMRRFFIFLTLFVLSGCSTLPYDWHFECPEKKGKPCMMMSQVNQMIDEEGVEAFEESNCTRGEGCQRRKRSIQKPREKAVVQTYFPSEEDRIDQEEEYNRA